MITLGNTLISDDLKEFLFPAIDRLVKLASVHRIVTSHRDPINPKRNPGEGSVITFLVAQDNR